MARETVITRLTTTRSRSVRSETMQPEGVKWFVEFLIILFRVPTLAGGVPQPTTLPDVQSRLKSNSFRGRFIIDYFLPDINSALNNGILANRGEATPTQPSRCRLKATFSLANEPRTTNLVIIKQVSWEADKSLTVLRIVAKVFAFFCNFALCNSRGATSKSSHIQPVN